MDALVCIDGSKYEHTMHLFLGTGGHDVGEVSQLGAHAICDVIGIHAV